MSKLIGIILILFSVATVGYFWHQSDKVEGAMLIRQGSNKMTVMQGSKKITANSNQNSFLNTGLVGMWSFNGGNVNWNTQRANDSTGSTNGTITNMSTTTSPIMGKVGQAFSFDGVNDQVRLAAYSISTLVHGSSGVSFSVWIKPNSFGTTGVRRRIINFQLTSSQSGGLIGTIGSTLEVGGRSTTTDSFQSATSSSLNAFKGKWIFAAGTLDFANDRIIVYINGEQKVTSTVTFNSNTYQKGATITQLDAIGSSVASEFFNGSIDEPRIYNRVLTAEEVTSLWQAGR